MLKILKRNKKIINGLSGSKSGQPNLLQVGFVEHLEYIDLDLYS